MTYTITTENLTETLALGNAIGRALKGGEVIELASDLGGGKTALTKGIAAGMGSEDTVQSPTFTISRVYRCTKGRELHHFDFYRLSDPGIMAAELAESVGDDKVVVVIEWSDIVADILPVDLIRVAIKVTDETKREFTFVVPESHSELAKTIGNYKEHTK